MSTPNPAPTPIELPNPSFLTKLWVRFLVKLLSSSHIQKWRRKDNRSPGSIIFVSSKLCIKATPFTRLAEAQTMQFISRTTTSIPVPKVHAAFEHNGRTFVLMERINNAAEPLSRGWAKRSDESKAKILAQLKVMVDELRTIPPPGGFVGVADVTGQGPIFDLRLPRKSHWGPFPSIEAFHRELWCGQDVKDFSEEQLAKLPGLKQLADFHYKQDWPKPVFTHGDLSSLNVMVRGDEVVAIIDWETAGWMPPYWEYTSAWHVNPQNMFWQAEVDKFITPDPWALEMEIIRRKYYGDF